MPHTLDFLPHPRYAGRMLRNVAVIAMDGVAAFELGVLCEVFGTDRTDDGFPAYRFNVCSPDGGPVASKSGFSIVPSADLAPVEDADLVAVPAHSDDAVIPAAVLDALRRADARGAYVMSVCSGAFVLGEAGLLDGRECTTHWRYADELALRFPLAKVSCNSLYVQDGNLLTSAGTAAGIDASLHLVRQVHGSEIATKLARRMVVPPHRDGGQSQYIEAPIPRTPDAPRWSRPELAAGQPRRARPRWTTSRPRRTWRRARSPGGSGPRPAPRRTTGSPASGCCSRGGSSRRPTSPSSTVASRSRLRRRRHAAPPLQPAGRRDPARLPGHVPRPRRLTAPAQPRRSWIYVGELPAVEGNKYKIGGVEPPRPTTAPPGRWSAPDRASP